MQRLSRSKNLPETVARILVSRGHSEPDAVEAHLRASPMGLHDPFLLPGMEAACDRLIRAMDQGETILIHGDYDVDGVTGTTLLHRLFELLGAKVAWHIPNRLTDGYSFGPHSVDRARETGATVVISVDNGTSAHTTIAELKAIGVDTVVTDHHEAPLGPLPDAAAIVNPKLPDSTYPWRELCGGAVAFKLAWGLSQRISGSGRAKPKLKRFLEEATALVAIATVCDVVPLLDENRIFGRFGLKALETTTQAGMRALLSVAGLSNRQLSAEDVAFQIGPRINASGRMGGAERAVELLLCDDPKRAAVLAEELNELNQRRKEVERGVLESARAQAQRFEDAGENPVLVLGGQGWHQGVVGIVAARLTEEYERPAIVIGLDGEEGRGSARTVGRFNVLEAMHGGADHMQRYGGHEQAAGCEIRADAVDSLRTAVCERAREMLAGGDMDPVAIELDDELSLGDVNPLLMSHLEHLEPFGAGNEKPIFSATAHLEAPAKRVGDEGKHLVLDLRDGHAALRGVAFGKGARADELAMGEPVELAFSPRWNTFRGRRNLELEIYDFRGSRTPG